MDRQVKSEVFEPISSNNAKQRTNLIEWLNGFVPDVSLPINASDEELQAFLVDGSVFCRLLAKLKPECDVPISQSRTQNVQTFLSAMDEMGLPRFHVADLEKGSMKIVLDCLLTLQTHVMLNIGKYNGNESGLRLKLLSRLRSVDASPRDESGFRSAISSPPFGEERRSRSQRGLRSPRLADLPAARISEMMKSNSLDNAPTQSLLSVVNGILDESVEIKNGEIPHRVACLLRKVVQEIERRICTQAEHLRTQNNLFKAREEKYQSRIRVLEALATGTSEETQIVMNQLQQIKSDKSKIEEKKKEEDHDLERVRKEKDELNKEITDLKQELERLKRLSEEELSKTNGEDESFQEIASLKLELERVKRLSEDESSKTNAKDELIQEIASLKQELIRVKRTSEEESSNMNAKVEVIQEITSLKHELEKVRRISSEEESSKTNTKDVVIQEISNLRQDLKEKDDLNKEISYLKREKDGLNQEMSNLKRELETARRSIVEVETSAKIQGAREGDQEIENLRQEIAVLKRHEDGLNQEMTTLKKELETSRQSISEVETSAKIQGSNVVNQEIENLRQEIAVLKNTLGKARSEEESLTKMKDMKDEEIGKLRQEIGGLKKEVEMSRRSSDEETSKLMDELNGELRKLREEVGEKEREVAKLRKEKESEVAKLTEEVEEREGQVATLRKEKESEVAKLRDEVGEREGDVAKLRDEVGEREGDVAKLKDEVEQGRRGIAEVESKLKEARNRVKEVEAGFESKVEWWNKKQQIYHIFTEFQLGALRELRFASQSIQQEVARTQNGHSEEFSNLGSRIKILGDAAKNYYPLLAENRKMHNELQELKGNIRVYCRVRPFIGGQKGKQCIVEHVGENGELVVANPAKPGKEGRRAFSFDKVYGPTATQAQVYTDTQPLIQSVLDGYNVCIFAYGQTGSGKTYTMTGPDGASEEEWGVNYRALNDLFNISEKRQGIFKYEVSVQMVEIYNEQVRDLLSNEAGQKKLGILSSSQTSGLAVPDASIEVVSSPKDVLKLMDVGLNNRAKSSTAMNERSSRSHSIVSIHTKGSDLKSGSSLRGSLHLVDLAGSERVDRSEVTGDRLKEAQHINKSLSALGDVIFALAQKSSHVPYRNSKLTQVLQSSLGGRAKTLMFVQLNPDATSFMESISTLKFAERVSGVELGAAKSSKEGRDVRELMEQVTTLKDTIAKKDEEIEALVKGGGTAEKRATSTLRTETKRSAETIRVHEDTTQTKNIDKAKSTPRVPMKSANTSTGLRKPPPSVTNPPTKLSRK